MILALDHIYKSYAANLILEDISLKIEDNDRIGLIGANGAGKSTLLKVIVGLQSCDEGTVSRNRSAQIGFLQQDSGLQGVSTIHEEMRRVFQTTIDLETQMHAAQQALAQCERKILFGVSPQGNMKNNLNSQYIDIQAWIDAGDIDYLCPQIYYGFENESAPYQTVVQEFSSMVRDSGVKLYVGLAPYKLGQEDKWAGEDGKEEWKTSQSLLARQIQAAREQTGYGGFALFRYGSLFTPGEQVSGQVQSEIQAMKQLF